MADMVDEYSDGVTHTALKEFNKLRLEGKMLDMDIVVRGMVISSKMLFSTMEKRSVPAHRLVLSTRFPWFTDQIVKHEGCRFNWDRFPTV